MEIRSCREAAGLTATELARKVGVTPAAVCRWEAGLDVPASFRLPRLAEAMGCTIDQLFGLAPPQDGIARPTA